MDLSIPSNLVAFLAQSPPAETIAQTPNASVRKYLSAQHSVFVVKQFRPQSNYARGQLRHSGIEWKRAARLPNIHNFLGIWDHPQLGPRFVTEYIGPNILSYLQDNPTTSYRIKFVMLQQVANALNNMHKQNPPILHTNVKASNVYVDLQTGNVFLSDIGVHAAITSHGQVDSCIRWRAREKVLSLVPSEYTKQCDCWSMGMTILEVLTGLPPFLTLNDQQIPLALSQGQHPGYPAGPYSPFVSQLINQLLDECWQNPHDRITMNIIASKLHVLSVNRS